MGITANSAAMGAPAPMEITADARKLNTTKALPRIPRFKLSQMKPFPIFPVFIIFEKMPMIRKIKISLEFPYWARP